MATALSAPASRLASSSSARPARVPSWVAAGSSVTGSTIVRVLSQLPVQRTAAMACRAQAAPPDPAGDGPGENESAACLVIGGPGQAEQPGVNCCGARSRIWARGFRVDAAGRGERVGAAPAPGCSPGPRRRRSRSCRRATLPAAPPPARYRARNVVPGTGGRPNVPSPKRMVAPSPS